ncbi:MAG: aldo/keto reductase [Paracoccaceae bacterium]|nr:aldo/keto reductase [Paracoccaceae bacterium]
MEMVELGRTGLKVSELCLGTMTWGSQNDEAEAHAQIDRSLEAGCNFMDTAEMYPTTPMRAETTGRTEELIGTWNARTGRRKDWVIATKITGRGNMNVRGGAGFDGTSIPQCIDASLKRLQTDYIDLYQLHWPDRGSYMFRQNWSYDPSGQSKAATLDHIHEVLRALDAAVKAGKVRHVGLSNESAWGTAQWLAVAEAEGLPRMEAIQNEYSLMCRLFDTDLAELSVNEDVTLLAFSPLACGFLTGKYQNGAVPEGSRAAINSGVGGRVNPRTFQAVDAYLDIANRHGLDPVHLALAFCRSRPFQTIPIFGATTMEQLDRALGAAGVRLSEEVLGEITAAHRAHPMPY